MPAPDPRSPPALQAGRELVGSVLLTDSRPGPKLVRRLVQGGGASVRQFWNQTLRRAQLHTLEVAELPVSLRAPSYGATRPVGSERRARGRNPARQGSTGGPGLPPATRRPWPPPIAGLSRDRGCGRIGRRARPLMGVEHLLVRDQVVRSPGADKRWDRFHGAGRRGGWRRIQPGRAEKETARHASR